MSTRKGRPKGAPDYWFQSAHLRMDARNVPMAELKQFHKWLQRYLIYWKGVK